MAIEFNCPSCSKLLTTSDERAFARAKCPACGDLITVPAPAASMAGGVPSPALAPTAAWAGPSGSPASTSTAAYSAAPPELAAEPVSARPQSTGPQSASWQAGVDCPRCGRPVDARHAYCSFCGTPLFAGAGPPRYSGFWRRVASCIIDLVMISFAAEFLSYIVPRGTWLAGNLWMSVWAIYHSVLESSRARATFGKRILGIVVCGSDGRRLTLPRAAIRTLAKILSVAICGVGLIMPLLTARKQALHDVLTDSVVVRK